MLSSCMLTHWRIQEPPLAPVDASTNSFLYVPLLLDAGGLMAPAVSQIWREKVRHVAGDDR